MTAVSLTAVRAGADAEPYRTRDGVTLALRHLDQTDYEPVRALHDAVLADLAVKKETSFFLPKSERQIRDCLNAGDSGMGRLGVTVGAYMEGVLVAVSSVTFPTVREDVALVVMPELPVGVLSEIRSTAVHPAFQGRGINHAVFRHQAEMLKVFRRVAVSEFDIHNIASWKTSVSLGMEIAYTGVDPDDGAQLMYGLLETEADARHVSRVEVRPETQWDELQRLLALGYRGIQVMNDGVLVCQRAFSD